MKVDN